jgi:hypothetical protein
VRPTLVIPIHWDNFFLPLHEHLEPLDTKDGESAACPTSVKKLVAMSACDPLIRQPQRCHWLSFWLVVIKVGRSG